MTVAVDEDNKSQSKWDTFSWRFNTTSNGLCYWQSVIYLSTKPNLTNNGRVNFYNLTKKQHKYAALSW